MIFLKDFLAHIVVLVLIILAMAGMLNLMALTEKDRLVTVQYDCRLSEISPDYPPAVKQMCREKMVK